MRRETDFHKSAKELAFETKAFIDGKFVDAKSGKTFETLNPATGQVLAKVGECDSADVDSAVEAARRAFEAGSWSAGDRASARRSCCASPT
jgi:gamma-glutamyl-gamma-aminobutyraldehyde dehydrogenase